MNNKIYELGWNNHFQLHLQTIQQETPDVCPARITRACRGQFILTDGTMDYSATLSGHMRYTCESEHDYVVTGDWVALRNRDEQGHALIHALLPRLNDLSRKIPGEQTLAQVMVANIDVCFLVCALDGSRSFNVRRIERYLTLAEEAHTEAVVLLNKADLCANPEACIAEVRAVARHVPVHAVSALTYQGLDQVQGYLPAGTTGVFLGSSGAGKSALTNALLGDERQTTFAVRAQDGRGRHTTTQRELLVLPAGGLIIDTPGLRELQLWGDEQGLSLPFADIEALAPQCRFRDCSHEGEPGCAVQEAMQQGELDAEHYRNYLQMRRELKYLAQRKDQRAALAERKKWKHIAKWQREYKKHEKN